MKELIDKVIEKLEEQKIGLTDLAEDKGFEFGIENAIEIVQKAAEEYNNGWIPVKYHVITDKEREEKCIPEDIAYYLDCKMPDDGEQIFVTDGENMWSDICFVDVCYSLDSGHDWINDIVAWQPIPERYQPVSNDSADAGTGYEKSAWRSLILRNFMRGSEV